MNAPQPSEFPRLSAPWYPLHPSINRTQDHLLHLHCPLHGGTGVRGVSMGGASFQKPPAYPVRRHGGHFTCYQQTSTILLTVDNTPKMS